LERRRRRAVELTARGEPRATVARILGVHPKTLARWVRAARRPGGLAARPQASPAPGLSDDQLCDLETLLLQGAKAHGWHNEFWTAARVARVIERHFDRAYHPEHVRKILKRRLKWTPQKPNQQNVDRDDEAIESWCREAFPAIMRAAAVRGADVVFVDETGFMLDPTVRRTFAPRGRTPALKVANPHARISVVGGVAVRPGTAEVGMQYGMLGDNLNFRWPTIAQFIRTLRSKLGRPLTVIWDRIPVHDCPALAEELAKDPDVVAELLPPHAPELNPADGIWRYVKHDRLPNYAPPDLGELRRTVTAELNRLRRRPGLLRGFIRFTGLPVGEPEAMTDTDGPRGRCESHRRSDGRASQRASVKSNATTH
jgi:transposase